MALYQTLDIAQSDIEYIFNYVARHNLKSAVQLLDKIYASCELLSDFPLIGFRRPALNQSWYFWPVDQYLIAYLPERPLTIIRVFSAYRNLSDLI